MNIIKRYEVIYRFKDDSKINRHYVNDVDSVNAIKKLTKHVGKDIRDIIILTVEVHEYGK